MKMGYLCLLLLLVFGVIGCQEESNDKVSVDLDQLIGSLGLDSNALNYPPEEQLGAIIFYRSRRLVDRLRSRLGVDEPTETVIQVQGKLADHFKEEENSDVVYFFGDLAEAVYRDLRDLFTIDDMNYLEGKEIIIMSGSETKTVLDCIKNRFNQYYSHSSQKAKRVYFTSLRFASSWVRDTFQTFSSDLKILFTTNPLKVSPLTTLHNSARVPEELTNGAFEGIQKMVLMIDQVWMLSFDSVGGFLAFLSGGGAGAEAIQESVVLRKTAQLGGETGYRTLFLVSEIFRGASGAYPNLNRDHRELRGILFNPLISIDISADVIKNSFHWLDESQQRGTEIVMGYISSDIERLGKFLNFVQKNPMGDFFIFVGQKTGQTLTLPSLALKGIIHFSENTLSALVGTLSLSKPLDAKLIQFRVVFEDLKGDLASLFKGFLKLIGISA